MKCLYQNCECRYQKDIGRKQTIQTLPCNECELYDPDEIKVMDGCFKPAKKIAVAIIILILLLM